MKPMSLSERLEIERRAQEKARGVELLTPEQKERVRRSLAFSWTIALLILTVVGFATWPALRPYIKAVTLLGGVGAGLFAMDMVEARYRVLVLIGILTFIVAILS